MATTVDLQDLAENYKIFVDTCSLMEDCSAEFFLKSSFQAVLKRVGARLIIPVRVIKELEKFSSRPDDPERRRKAQGGLQLLKVYEDARLLDYRGEEGDDFPDNLFLAVFTMFRMRHQLCLITQDTLLSEAILDLGRTDGPVKRVKPLKVCRLNPAGALAEFTRRNTAGSCPRPSKANAVDLSLDHPFAL